jgi:predicted enzyme related to lactoylglutathione lyase
MAPVGGTRQSAPTTSQQSAQSASGLGLVLRPAAAHRGTFTATRIYWNTIILTGKNQVMADSGAAIVDVIIDCSEPEVVASFWADLLGRPIAGRKGPYVWLTRFGAESGLGFQRVLEPKAGKNRVHLDISGLDLPALRARVIALGGREIDGFEDGGFLVMADPEGNEFCVVPNGPVDFDDEGRTRYREHILP